MTAIYLFAVFAVLALIADCGQTLRIKAHPGMFELKLILGSHPSDAKVRTYFTLCIVGFLLLVFAAIPALSNNFEQFRQGAVCTVVLTVELVVIWRNRKLGL